MKLKGIKKGFTAPTILKLDFYTEGANVFTSNDKSLFYHFDTYGDYEKFAMKYSGIVNVAEIHYFKGENFIIVFTNRLSKNYYTKSLEMMTNLCMPDSFEFMQANCKAIVKRYLVERDKEEGEKRKSEGYVCYTYPLAGKSIRGNLKQLYTQNMKEYIGEGGAVFGYVGHSGRKFYMDDYWEYLIVKVQDILKTTGFGHIDVVSCLDEWLRSSSARHWMDNVEDVNKNEFKREAKKIYLQLLINRTPIGELGRPKSLIMAALAVK